MSSFHEPQNFPTVPKSLSTGGHGTRDFYAEQEPTAARPAPHTLQDLTPYLGLRARLSQVWINRWTILILLVLARVLIAIGNLHNDIDKAKTEALAACASVEAMGSTMASMPHYLAQGTNQLAAHGVEKAVNGLEQMLTMSITALEEIFVFVVNMMYGTYECLITIAVSSAAHAGIALIEDATPALNKTINDFDTSIKNTVGSFQNDLNTFLGTFNNIGNFITGGSNKAPTLDISASLNQLNKFTIPTDINDKLSALNKSIPDFAQVKNATNTILELPFEDIKRLVNQSLGTYTFDQSVFPVPQRRSLSFCSDNDGVQSFFDQLYNVADIARKVFIAVLLIAAILVCIPMALREIRRWRTMQQRSQLVQQKALDPIDVVYIVSHPYTAGAGIKLSQRFSAPRKQVLVRWFIAYITSVPALIVLSIALAGLFSCLCQFILLKAIEKEVPSLVNTVGAFTEKVVTALEGASVEWANGTNAAILAENTKINNDVFGWVNTSTTTINATIASFINETEGLINQTFGGTVLEEPIFGLFQCLVGIKAQNIEAGLTWLHDNAHVNFPLFPNDTFSVGAQKAVASSDPTTGTSNDSFVADPGSNATDRITAAVLDLTNKLEDGIRTEAILSTLILCAYLAVVFMGLARVLFKLMQRDRTRAEGGASYAGDLPPVDTGDTIAHNFMGGGFMTSNPTGDSAFAHSRAAPTMTTNHAGSLVVPPQETGQTVRESVATQWSPNGKVGFGGQRSPPLMQGSGHGLSMYGVLEDEKRGLH